MPKKKARKLKISRERWKNKYVTVIRENGKIQSWKSWTPNQPLRQSKSKFSRDQTLQKGITKQKLTNFRVVNDFSRPVVKTKVPKTVMAYQVIATVRVGKKKISAVSMQHDLDFPRERAEKEAIRNLENLVYESEFGRYPEQQEEAEIFIRSQPQKIGRIKTGVRYYRPLSSERNKATA